ncbi:hypothetical protein NDR87_15870 [Nocardia sp. CDC159]|uniref:Uncharacterized protein n=1 Tax=Nocardia pulmonis TaxID=2951408 RepID=A0A9X2E7Z4_9NOCA|nr:MULTISPECIES: hypothetical protein [Nocardia]MCM6775429.1 hypothetical protein [Nocardia pulmonis]MCM6787837.1 hypothetical protein [Nocardia sp. CDC159]
MLECRLGPGAAGADAEAPGAIGCGRFASTSGLGVDTPGGAVGELGDAAGAWGGVVETPGDAVDGVGGAVGVLGGVVGAVGVLGAVDVVGAWDVVGALGAVGGLGGVVGALGVAGDAPGGVAGGLEGVVGAPTGACGGVVGVPDVVGVGACDAGRSGGDVLNGGVGAGIPLGFGVVPRSAGADGGVPMVGVLGAGAVGVGGVERFVPGVGSGEGVVGVGADGLGSGEFGGATGMFALDAGAAGDGEIGGWEVAGADWVPVGGAEPGERSGPGVRGGVLGSWSAGGVRTGADAEVGVVEVGAVPTGAEGESWCGKRFVPVSFSDRVGASVVGAWGDVDEPAGMLSWAGTGMSARVGDVGPSEPRSLSLPGAVACSGRVAEPVESACVACPGVETESVPPCRPGGVPLGSAS